jgi:hypothetical protein
MLALLSFALAASAGSAPSVTPPPSVAQGHTRNYFIAADEVVWDYAPTGINQISGKPFEGIQTFFTKQGRSRSAASRRKHCSANTRTHRSARSSRARRTKPISASLAQ